MDSLGGLQSHCSGKQYAQEKAESGDKNLLKFVWTLNFTHLNKKVGLAWETCKKIRTFF